jgi:hypothetical protein
MLGLLHGSSGGLSRILGQKNAIAMPICIKNGLKSILKKQLTYLLVHARDEYPVT